MTGGRITVRDLIERPTWMELAACRDMDTTRFFPPSALNGRHHERGPGAKVRALEQVAVAVCRTCDVQIECLAYAVNNREDYGIWGGLTEHQRLRLRRTRRTA